MRRGDRRKRWTTGRRDFLKLCGAGAVALWAPASLWGVGSHGRGSLCPSRVAADRYDALFERGASLAG